MAYVVGPKGQVVIAKDIRDEFGVEPGWVALQRVVGDHVEVYFLAPEHRRSLKGSLAGYIKAEVAADDAWDQAREAAWGEAARQKERVSESSS